MIDSHCHIYDPAFEADRAEVLRRAAQAGVRMLLMPNEDSSTYAAMMSVAQQFPQCRPVIGVHPTSVKRDWEQQLEFVQQTLQTMPRGTFVAVGEIGMDTHWGTEFMEQQKTVFAAQLHCAHQHQLPVMIHAREAFPQTFEVLRSHPHPVRGVFHAFSGDVAIYHEMKQCGDFKIGVGGVVTFKSAHALAEVVAQVPLRDILLETDAPYLTPAPHRGKRNESAYLTYIVQKIAELKHLSAEEVVQVTTQNVREMFLV